MKTVILSPTEQFLARTIAEYRTASNRAADTPNGNNSDRSDFDLDLGGFSGELAFAKLFNVYPDFTSEPRSAAKGQDNGDCVVNGLLIDVKTTASDKPYARVKARKRGCADVFAFMHGKFPEYRFLGFVTHDVIFSDWNRKVFDDGAVVYSVPWGALVQRLEDL